MEKVILVIMLLATVTSADVSVQCSEQFISKHGSSFPVSGSCEKYLECSGGQLVEQACQGGLHFNVELSRCVPEIEANCSRARRHIIDNGKCNNSDEISFHPDPHHCAGYVLCLGNTTIPRLCAAGLLFNAETGQCDFPQNVFCDVTCPSGGNELVFIGDSSGRDCARYSICLKGVPRPAKCSSMLYFDLVTGSCMQPEDAACRIRDVVCTSSDEMLADSESCVSYYQCEGGLPHYRECDEGQIFSGGRCVPGYCGDREDTTVDGTSTVSPTAVVTETSTSHATSELTTDHSSTTVDLGTSTITGTTTSTIVTSEAANNPSTNTEIVTSTVPIISSTTESVTSSTITTSATTPATIPEVTSTTQTETLSTSTITADVTTESNISTGSSSPESTSVTSVITPESTTPVQTGSPSTVTSTQGSSSVASSTISPESSTLTTPITTTDSSTPTQTESPPTTESTNSTPTEPPPSTDPAIVCRGTGIALFPHPYRCDQYFVCIFGSGSLATCDGGLLFDRKSMVCVPADRVTCALN